jgi:hypothetical protein
MHNGTQQFISTKKMKSSRKAAQNILFARQQEFFTYSKQNSLFLQNTPAQLLIPEAYSLDLTPRDFLVPTTKVFYHPFSSSA